MPSHNKEHTREDKLADTFLILGTQYYVLARYAADSYVIPVCANLYHHAIEMLIKGCLVHKVDISELKRLKHRLDDLWVKLKAQNEETGLNGFDLVISNLDKFEEIRYPDKLVGDATRISIRRGPGPLLSYALLGEPPTHKLDVHELDKLVSTIFRLSPFPPNAYFRNFSDDLKRGLPKDLLQ